MGIKVKQKGTPDRRKEKCQECGRKAKLVRINGKPTVCPMCAANNTDKMRKKFKVYGKVYWGL